MSLLSLGAVDAELSATELVVLEDAASEAVAAVVGYLVLGLLGGAPCAEEGHGRVLVQLVGLEAWAGAAELFADLHVLGSVRYLAHTRNQDARLNDGIKMLT